jgi:hypothetical protein
MWRTTDRTCHLSSYCPQFLFPPNFTILQWIGLVISYLSVQTQRALSIGRIKNCATEGIWYAW